MRISQATVIALWVASMGLALFTVVVTTLVLALESQEKPFILPVLVGVLTMAMLALAAAATLWRRRQRRARHKSGGSMAVEPIAKRPERDETDEDGNGATASAGAAPLGLTVAVLLLGFGILLQQGLQSIQLIGERDQLTQAKAGQDRSIQDAQKVRTQADALATQTARLAAQGNANARAIIEELRRQGVTVKEPAATTPPAAAGEAKQ